MNSTTIPPCWSTILDISWTKVAGLRNPFSLLLRWKTRADRNSSLCVYACVCTCINTSYDKHYGTPSLKIAAEQKQRLLWWYALNDGREACNIREEHSHLPIRGITGCTFHTVLSSTVLAIASHLLRSVPMKISSNHTPSTSARGLANLDCARPPSFRRLQYWLLRLFASSIGLLASEEQRWRFWTAEEGLDRFRFGFLGTSERQPSFVFLSPSGST